MNLDNRIILDACSELSQSLLVAANARDQCHPNSRYREGAASARAQKGRSCLFGLDSRFAIGVAGAAFLLIDSVMK